MEIDWDAVKKQTLWSYEELIERILNALTYNFIQRKYDHNMKEAENYVASVFSYDPKYSKTMAKLTRSFERLGSMGIGDYSELIQRVEDREKCEHFIRAMKLPFQDLIFVLNYVMRWVLPFSRNLRELVDATDEASKKHLEELRKIGMKSTLDILEQGSTKTARQRIASETGIPEPFVQRLVNRADIARLPYMAGKTVNHLCSAGYDSLEKLAQADKTRLKADVKSYFDKIGVRLSKSFIDLDGIVDWARAVPKIIEP